MQFRMQPLWQTRVNSLNHSYESFNSSNPSDQLLNHHDSFTIHVGAIRVHSLAIRVHSFAVPPRNQKYILSFFICTSQSCICSCLSLSLLHINIFLAQRKNNRLYGPLLMENKMEQGKVCIHQVYLFLLKLFTVMQSYVAMDFMKLWKAHRKKLSR